MPSWNARSRPYRSVSFELNVPWRMLAAYLEKLGPPKFRRWLSDLAIILIPDKNLGRLKTIINTMDDTANIILRQKKEEEKEGIQQDVGEGTDVMSILCESDTNLGSIASSSQSRTVQENAQSTTDDQLTDAELLAQMS